MQILANAAGTASWFYRGTALTSNTSLTLNTGDSLAITCNAIAASLTGNQLYPAFMVMFATSSTTNPVLTITFTSGTSPTPISAIISASAGTLIYDSFSGTQATWSHWLVTNSIVMPTFSQTTSSMSRGILSIFIPRLITTDAGTMYCFYADAVTSGISNLAASNGFTLTLTTKSSASTNQARSKYLEYSMLLLGASKLVL